MLLIVLIIIICMYVFTQIQHLILMKVSHKDAYAESLIKHRLPIEGWFKIFCFEFQQYFQHGLSWGLCKFFAANSSNVINLYSTAHISYAFDSS